MCGLVARAHESEAATTRRNTPPVRPAETDAVCAEGTEDDVSEAAVALPPRPRRKRVGEMLGAHQVEDQMRDSARLDDNEQRADELHF